MSLPASLEDAIERAGAVRCTDRGVPVVVHYGSAAGELAVCAAGVGLLVRPDMQVRSLRGSCAELERVIAERLEVALFPGGITHSGRAWWGRSASGDRLTRLCEPPPQTSPADLEDARQTTDRSASLDRSQPIAVIQLVGRNTWALLRHLGLASSDDLRAAEPCLDVVVGGTAVTWLIPSDVCAFALVDRGKASRLWGTIRSEGTGYGLGYVGVDAMTRYGIARRHQQARPDLALADGAG